MMIKLRWWHTIVFAVLLLSGYPTVAAAMAAPSQTPQTRTAQHANAPLTPIFDRPLASKPVPCKNAS